MSNQPFALLRPVRATGLLFAGLVALFAVCAPFIAEVDTVEFVLGGAAYSLFLALFVVGLALVLPSRVMIWWIRLAPVPALGMASFWLWFTQADPDTFFRTFPWVGRGLLVVLWAYLAMGLLIASWGWVRYACWRRSDCFGERGT